MLYVWDVHAQIGAKIYFEKEEGGKERWRYIYTNVKYFQDLLPLIKTIKKSVYPPRLIRVSALRSFQKKLGKNADNLFIMSKIVLQFERKYVSQNKQ